MARSTQASWKRGGCPPDCTGKRSARIDWRWWWRRSTRGRRRGKHCDPQELACTALVVRERGSGTRSALDRALHDYQSVAPTLELSSNAGCRERTSTRDPGRSESQGHADIGERSVEGGPGAEPGARKIRRNADGNNNFQVALELGLGSAGPDNHPALIRGAEQ